MSTSQSRSMNILMICATFPYPPTRGGTQGRTFNLLKILSQSQAVTLLTQRTTEVTEEEIEQLRQYVTELVVFPRPVGVKTSLVGKIQRFGEFLSQGRPPNVQFIFSPPMQDWMDQAIAARKFEVITAEHSVNELFIRPEWRKTCKTVIDIHSSIYRTCKNQLETQTSDYPLRDRLYLPLLRRYEQGMLAKFSEVVVTTDEDAEQMQVLDPQAKITLIPNGVDLETFPYRNGDPGGHHLVFVGGLDYFVNINAAVFFSREVLPLLQQQYPDTTLTLVGSKPSPEIQSLAQLPGITVTGRVPSVADYLHQATVAVIPLRTGFGMKFKTLESMAAGAPVVASDRGLEGMAVDRPDVPLRALRANDVNEYLTAIGRLFDDPDLRAQLSRNGREFIEQNYTWEILGQQYAQLLTQS